jgi:hypothetical protein
MAITTFAELKEAAANWIARDDLTARIPEFIVLAEAKFNRLLKCHDMEQRSTAPVDTTSDEPEFLSLPADYQSMRRVRLSSVTGKPRLVFLANAMMDEKRYARANATGQPIYFTITGAEMELFPTPDGAYTLEMTYRKLIPALATNSANWLLTNHPDAYLYGTLMEAEPYMKNDARIAVWGSGLSAVIEQINSVSDQDAFNAGPLNLQVSGPTP